MEQFTLENIRNVALLSHSEPEKPLFLKPFYSMLKPLPVWVRLMKAIPPQIMTRMK